MSYTEIYGFGKDGKAYKQDEAKNAWRGAIAIWKALEEKYLPPYKPKYESLVDFKPSRVMEEACKEIWELFGNETVSKIDRIILGTTFDRAVVKKEDIPQVIKAFLAFDGETNLPEQAEILKTMLEDEDCIGVAWNQTSVNADTWEGYEYDEEKDESIPYNLLSGKEHWFLFDDLKALSANRALEELEGSF